MQHWNIYLLWNERFFNECYGAFKMGRAASDPSEGWYKGEIGFFDFYIVSGLFAGVLVYIRSPSVSVFQIPLAKKLESCGVFGVSSDEYLGYAVSNRDLWVQQGEEIVQGYLAKFEQGDIESLLRSAAMTESNDYSYNAEVEMTGHEVDLESCGMLSI